MCRLHRLGPVEKLVPIRHSRMLESPFTFFRGTAALQAADTALGKYAMAYADRAEADFEALRRARPHQNRDLRGRSPAP